MKQSGNMLPEVDLQELRFHGEDLTPKMIVVVLWLISSRLRGNYVADQALYTVEADAYEPNDYNLYNMAGNVAEWTMSSYHSSSYEFSSSINPNVTDSSNKP